MPEMTADPHAVQISVDGSCYPNEGRKSGYAGIVLYPDNPTEHEIVFQGFVESTINSSSPEVQNHLLQNFVRTQSKVNTATRIALTLVFSLIHAVAQVVSAS